MFLFTSLMLIGCQNKGLILIEEQEVEPAEEPSNEPSTIVQPSVEPMPSPHRLHHNGLHY